MTTDPVYDAAKHGDKQGAYDDAYDSTESFVMQEHGCDLLADLLQGTCEREPSEHLKTMISTHELMMLIIQSKTPESKELYKRITEHPEFVRIQQKTANECMEDWNEH